MAFWSPWRGCKKVSEGCRFCYIHKGDLKRVIDTNDIVKTKNFFAPIERNKNGEYKIKSGEMVYTCFSTDFLIEDADTWREQCLEMIKTRSDLEFLFLTKRIDRFEKLIHMDCNNKYDNLHVGISVENQKNVDLKLSVLSKLPIKHKMIICQPLLENVSLKNYLVDIDLVVVGGESDKDATPLDFKWVRSIHNECKEAGVKFEFRQTGSFIILDGVKKSVSYYSQMKLARELELELGGKT